MRYARLLKAQAASLAGTLVDFAATLGCVELLHANPVPASMLGNVLGGVTNFWLGRYFVFNARRRNPQAQAGRYFLVWLGSMALNAGGLYLFTHLLGLKYLASKIVVSLIVGIGFNYVMQLYFVFRKS